ncbi:MAG: hypothetical protein M0027_05890 [Candidatus Dormibacteraeota bacterium]|jgi:hypothetical protein|nr:hypothetical protein [Candidatus Dormibacteraeota bacterium]
MLRISTLDLGELIAKATGRAWRQELARHPLPVRKAAQRPSQAALRAQREDLRERRAIARAQQALSRASDPVAKSAAAADLTRLRLRRQARTGRA